MNKDVGLNRLITWRCTELYGFFMYEICMDFLKIGKYGTLKK